MVSDDVTAPGFFSTFYQEELYIINEQPAGDEPLNATGNQQAAILVAAASAAGQLSADEAAFLQSVLKAAGIEMAEVMLLVLKPQSQVQWQQIVALPRVRQVLAFGLPVRALPPGAAAGQLLREGSINYISMPEVAAVAANRDLKRVLWDNMKLMFKL